MGSIGCKIASLIRGESDIYISLSLPGKSAPKDWDFAAPEAILKSSGGAITDLYNQELIYGKSNFEQGGVVIASNNFKTHKNLCLEIKEVIKKYNIFPLPTLIKRGNRGRSWLWIIHPIILRYTPQC